MNAFFGLAITTLLLLGACAAYAGFDKGNGGDGFVCPNRSVPYLLAEEIESEINWSIPLRPRELVPSVAEQPETILSNLATVLPVFALETLGDLTWLDSRRIFTTGVDLDNLSDDVIGWTPADCTQTQVAIQTKTNLIITGEFWDAMDERSRRMLLTHEAIYRALERTMNNQKITLVDSRAVRLLNSYAWRDESKIGPGFDLRFELDQLGVKNLR